MIPAGATPIRPNWMKGIIHETGTTFAPALKCQAKFEESPPDLMAGQPTACRAIERDVNYPG